MDAEPAIDLKKIRNEMVVAKKDAKKKNSHFSEEIAEKSGLQAAKGVLAKHLGGFDSVFSIPDEKLNDLLQDSQTVGKS